MSNSLQLISKNAIDSLNKFTVEYNEQWKYTNLNHYKKFNLSLVDNYSKIDMNYSSDNEIILTEIQIILNVIRIDPKSFSVMIDALYILL